MFVKINDLNETPYYINISQIIAIYYCGNSVWKILIGNIVIKINSDTFMDLRQKLENN